MYERAHTVPFWSLKVRVRNSTSMSLSLLRAKEWPEDGNGEPVECHSKAPKWLSDIQTPMSIKSGRMALSWLTSKPRSGRA